MKALFLNIVVILLLMTTSCKKKLDKSPLNLGPTNKNIVKQDIDIDYPPIYLSPKSRPIVVNWHEYIDVQNKVYGLKNTNTEKLNEQLKELDILITKLLNSHLPEKLQTHLFERKLNLLGESVTDLRVLLGKESTQLEDIEKGIYKILQSYSVSKNQINAIYGG